MNILREIFTNPCLLCAIFSWLLAQILKSVVEIIRLRRFSFVSVFASGGMPSSHSAAVSSLATAVGFEQGFHTPLFALSVLFAFIVMYDATGVRRETGEQAKALNALMADLDQGNTENIPTHFKELVGHSPVQVFAGACVGVGLALLLYLTAF